MPEPGRTGDRCLEAAPGYLARQWSVLPAPERGKRPIVRWQAYQDGHPSEAQVRHWFERWTAAIVAVVTGAASGIVVLDGDPKHGGEESLTRLALHNAGLPDTVEAITGGGGRHVYFKHPGLEVRGRQRDPRRRFSTLRSPLRRSSTAVAGPPVMRHR